jgi:hypothetical protein
MTSGGIPRWAVITLLLGSLWVFPSCGGDDAASGDDGGDSATTDVKTADHAGDGPTSNAGDSAAE